MESNRHTMKEWSLGQTFIEGGRFARPNGICIQHNLELYRISHYRNSPFERFHIPYLAESRWSNI